MNNIIKAFLLIAVIFFSWNIAIDDIHAAESPDQLSTAVEIKNYKDFSFDKPLKDVQLNDENKYVKYYKVQISAKTELSIDAWDEDKKGFDIALLDSKGEPIKVSYDIDKSFGYGVYFTYDVVTSGTYYLKVTADTTSLDYLDGWSTAVVSEKESNNTMKTANKIDINLEGTNKVTGKFSGSNSKDVDYYKFTLTKPTTSLYFDFGYEDDFVIQDAVLLDSKGKEISDVNGFKANHPYFSPYLKAGTYYIKLTSDKESYGKNYSFSIFSFQATPSVKASNVTVTSSGSKIKVQLKNLVVGYEYQIYSPLVDLGIGWSSYPVKKFVADKTTKTLELNVTDQKGFIFVTAYDKKTDESAYTKVAFTSSPIKASNVTVKNNFSKTKDVVTFQNLVKGETYTIYKDANKNTKLKSFKATSKSKTVELSQKLATKGGSIYVTVKKPNYKVSKTTKVTYKAEKLPALKAKNVTIKNNVGKDEIKLKALTKGYTYTVYKDKNRKYNLATFTAKGSTKTLKVAQVGTKAGNVYIVASKQGYRPSSATKVAYKAQPKK